MHIHVYDYVVYVHGYTVLKVYGKHDYVNTHVYWMLVNMVTNSLVFIEITFY